MQYSIFVGVYVGFVTIGLLSPYWLEFILLYLIPQRIGLTITVYFFAHIQHPDDVTFESHPFQTTAYIPTNLLQKILMLGQADHHIHHLLPNLPFYQYTKIWNLANGLLHAPALPKGSFWRKATPHLESTTATVTFDVNITDIADVGNDIRRLSLSLPNGNPLPEFSAGSHVAVQLPSGKSRHYSLCNDPSERRRYDIAVKRDDQGGGGSKKFMIYCPVLTLRYRDLKTIFYSTNQVRVLSSFQAVSGLHRYLPWRID